MAATKPEHHAFEAEVGQLLDLVAHSLYSHKEIFLRELISNAADACDRLRFEALSDDALLDGDSELGIRIETDPEAGTLTLTDNGIGMRQAEVIDNIGTIARSGTRAFLQSVTDQDRTGLQQIGQFGVGFYSAFIVADRVELVTRRAGLKRGVRWESNGRDGYELNKLGNTSRGTAITLHLKEDAKEFLDEYQLRTIVKRYSDHVPFPIRLRVRDEAGEPTDDWEVVNQADALWARPRKELTDDDYRDFYPHVAHDSHPPLAWTHHRVEGHNEYSLLLYVPSKAAFDLYESNAQHGVKLYVQRVFILEEPDKLLPRYLRFVRGVVDSSDLPLNVSRELLQSNQVLDKIRSSCVTRVLDRLEKLSTEEPEQYRTFWDEFGRVFKEGVIEDLGNHKSILKLLRFYSTHAPTEVPEVRLEDYVARAKEGQDKIYFLTADSLAAAQGSPHLEIFRKQGIEVLLLADPVDEWMMNWLTDYDDLAFQSIAKGEIDLPQDNGSQQPSDQVAEAEPLCARIKEALGDQVEAVRPSSRLTDSPSCLVRGDRDFSPLMQEILQRQGQAAPKAQLTLEVNPEHPLLKRMQIREEQFSDWAAWLFDQAVLADGGVLKNPSTFISRMNTLLGTSTDEKSSET